MKKFIVALIALSAMSAYGRNEYSTKGFEGEICPENFSISSSPAVSLTCFKKGALGMYTGGKTFNLKSKSVGSPAKSCINLSLPAQSINVGNRRFCQLSISIQGITEINGQVVKTTTRGWAQETLTGVVRWNGVSTYTGADLDESLHYIFKRHKNQNSMNCSTSLSPMFDQEIIDCPGS